MIFPPIHLIAASRYIYDTDFLLIIQISIIINNNKEYTSKSYRQYRNFRIKDRRVLSLISENAESLIYNNFSLTGISKSQNR